MIVDLDATTIDGREFTLSIAPGSPTVIAVETDDLPLAPLPADRRALSP